MPLELGTYSSGENGLLLSFIRQFHLKARFSILTEWNRQAAANVIVGWSNPDSFSEKAKQKANFKLSAGELCILMCVEEVLSGELGVFIKN